jgi:hypothetical protein
LRWLVILKAMLLSYLSGISIISKIF